MHRSIATCGAKREQTIHHSVANGDIIDCIFWLSQLNRCSRVGWIIEVVIGICVLVDNGIIEDPYNVVVGFFPGKLEGVAVKIFGLEIGRLDLLEFAKDDFETLRRIVVVGSEMNNDGVAAAFVGAITARRSRADNSARSAIIADNEMCIALRVCQIALHLDAIATIRGDSMEGIGRIA